MKVIKLESELLLKKFWALDINKSVLGLEQADNKDIYFCTPMGAKIIGRLGVDGIHFCSIPLVYGEMVFSVSPMLCGKHYVEPIAENFEDFLSLVCACGNSSPLEQISYVSEAEFSKLLQLDDEAYKSDAAVSVTTIQNNLGIKKCVEPYKYVKDIQMNFNYAQIPYSKEYYDSIGE
jgi:hypothetical protein